MKKWFLIPFLWTLALSLFICNPQSAYAEENHSVTISWFYCEWGSDLINGEAGEKLNTIVLNDIPNGEFNFSNYVNNPEGATFYKMLAGDQTPIIRINGNYYLISSKYFGGNSSYDDWNNIIYFTDVDKDVEIKLVYSKIQLYQKQKLDKITISINDSINENLIEPHQYSAYQIFHVTKSDNIQEDVTTDETIGQTFFDSDFNYYIKETDEWYSVIANMTEYFNLIPTTQEGIYNVLLKEEIPTNESTAIEIAKKLEENVENKTSITLFSNETKEDLDPGYYLIISPVNSNLILATTNIDITEKAFYPTIDKTIKEEDKNSTLNSDIIFTSKIFIPRGSKAEIKIIDNMTEGLTFKEDSLQLNYPINYNIETNSQGFTLTIPANQTKEIAKEEDITLILNYIAKLNKKAIVKSTFDITNESNINHIKLEYANYIQEDQVEINTSKFTILKYAGNDNSKTPLGGATFNLYDDQGNKIKFYELIPNQKYRVATDEDSSYMTDITTEDNNLLEIIGLDADIIYKLKEIKAPDGYNLCRNDIEVKPLEDLSLVVEVINNTGGILPSTGGIGTGVFYLVGGFLIAGSSILILSKKFRKQIGQKKIIS